MMTVTVLFLAGAAVAAILELMKKCPQGVATLLLCVVVALLVLPK
jgi:hypothetical protein